MATATATATTATGDQEQQLQHDLFRFVFEHNNQEYEIGEMDLTDVDGLVKSVNFPEVYENTLALPYPYTADAAQWWINRNLQIKKEKGFPMNFFLRLGRGGEVIGSVGIALVSNGEAEIGYLLTPAQWGKGIMPACVGHFCRVVVPLITQLEFDFNQQQQSSEPNVLVHTVKASIFSRNHKSARVLEKNQFTLRDVLPKHYKKQRLVSYSEEGGAKTEEEEVDATVYVLKIR